MDKITNQIKSYKFEVKDEDDDDDDFEEINDCKYYSIDTLKKRFSNLASSSILHLKVHSIERHIEESQVILNLSKLEFDILCFFESKIVEGTPPKSSIILKGYQEPAGMPTKVTKGGVFNLYQKWN